MMTSWLIDTNVLIYSFDQTSQFHKPSYDFIAQSLTGELNLYISHQNLLEFTAVVTNPKRVAHPLSIEEAFQKIAIYQTSFSVICPQSETFFTYNRLISKYPTFRERIFDIYLVATAIDNNVRQICTWNKRDFEKINEIRVKDPKEILLSVKK